MLSPYWSTQASSTYPTCSPSASRALQGSLQYSYPYETPTCWEWGNCKCHVFEESRNSGDDVRVVMIGDGYSDYCAARLADASFARAAMRDHCDANGVAYIPFEDFHDVLDAFRAGIPGVWEPETAAERGKA